MALNNKPKGGSERTDDEATRVASKQSPATKTKVSNSNARRLPANERMPLGKTNFVMIGISLLLIVIGFWLMTGSSNTGKEFNYAIFESRRLVAAPIVTFLGFLLMVPAIMFHRAEDDNQDLNNHNNGK